MPLRQQRPDRDLGLLVTEVLQMELELEPLQQAALVVPQALRLSHYQLWYQSEVKDHHPLPAGVSMADPDHVMKLRLEI